MPSARTSSRSPAFQFRRQCKDLVIIFLLGVIALRYALIANTLRHIAPSEPSATVAPVEICTAQQRHEPQPGLPQLQGFSDCLLSRFL